MAGKGRPSCPEVRHFTLLKELGKAPGGYAYRECSFCRAAYNNDVTTDLPKVLIGRPRNYARHLASCEYYKAAQLPLETESSASATTPAALGSTPTSSSERASNLLPSVDDTPNVTPLPRAPRSSKQPPLRSSARLSSESHARRVLVLDKRQASSPTRLQNWKRLKPVSGNKTKPKRKFSKAEVKKIECSLIEMHAVNHLADRFIENEATLRFLELISPGIADILPSRRSLSNRILKEHAERCKTMDVYSLKKMATRTSGWVNLLSDVWQNVSKDHLLGCQLSLFGELLTYDLLPAGDRHDGIAIAEQLENVLEKVQEEMWRVGGVVTDDAGQCSRARRILALRWPQIVFLFCFAHDINNLVKAVLRSAFRGVAAKAATAVNTLNASSSKWLLRATRMMKQLYGRSLGLRTLCETRWNSMQGCFASLLRVQSALQMFYQQYKSKSDFPETLRVFGETSFWGELKEAEAVIAPLSLASYRLQRDENTVGDVVRSFADIHKGFQQHFVRRDMLLECVEKRWAKCEQPLFMLGFALHPVYVAIARDLPETDVSGIGTLTKIAVYYHRRLLATEDLGELRRDIISWMRGELTNIKATEFRAPWEYWDAVALENPNSLLPKLAIRVLSIAVNTATCERLFSELGLIHTAKRNRMGATKALDFHIIAKHVRQRSQKKATVSENPKKKLLISPIEREINEAASNAHNLFTPSPQQGRGAADGDSDNEDPGDGVDGDPTLTLWGEFLDEVFEDEEIDSGYVETAVHADGGAVREAREPQVNNCSSELEAIPEAIKQAFTVHNDRNFPQEAITLRGFRGRKATLEELFESHVNR